MLMTLTDAQKINPDITEEAIEALASTIRAEANNHFHRQNYSPIIKQITGATVHFTASLNLFKNGDTVELVGTDYFDGFYQVVSSNVNSIELNRELIDHYEPEEANIYQISYPLDVVEGAKKVLEYGHKMSNKLGVKSESVSRVSVSYYDVDRETGLIFGVPSYLFTFLDPYRKRRFG